MKKGTTTCGVLAAGLVGLAAGIAVAEPITHYSQDFEGAAPWGEWSVSTSSSNATYSRFLGRFDNSTAMLTVPVPAFGTGSDGDDNGSGGGDGDGGGGGDGGSGREFFVTFDLYIIESWDGTDWMYGPDLFEVTVNGERAMYNTFSNFYLDQSLPFVAFMGPENVGYASWPDSAYRITLPLEVNGPEWNIAFRGIGLQGIADESWGLDNVNVWSEAVPAPGAGVVMMAGLVAMGRRRR